MGVVRRIVVVLVAGGAAVSACTGPAGPTATSRSGGPPPTTAASVLPAPTARPVGQANCQPPSPYRGGEVQGTSADSELWGLVFANEIRAGKDVKIVWRMTGAGELTVAATSPSGVEQGTRWGPEPHAGSTWQKPGEEWGTGFTFDEPGCWHLALRRERGSGDVWLVVGPAE